MNARRRFTLAVAVLGLLMTGPFTLTVMLLWADMGPAERSALTGLLWHRVPIGATLTIAGFVVGVVVLRRLFRQYVQGLLRMAEHLRLMRVANPDYRVAVEGPPEVRELAQAVNDLAQAASDMLVDVDARIAVAHGRLEQERNRLAALMSELALAVIACNLDGRILLYNRRAVAVCAAFTAGRGGARIGLGRPIQSVFEPAQITHAIDAMRYKMEQGAEDCTTQFVVSAPSGRLLRVHVAAVLGGEQREWSEVVGTVLTLEDITTVFEQESERDQRVLAVTAENRAQLGQISTALAAVLPALTLSAEQRAHLEQAAASAAAINRDLGVAMDNLAARIKQRWPLEALRGSDVLAAAERRIGESCELPIKREEIDDQLWLRADAFLLIHAIRFLAAQLQDHYQIRELRFRLMAVDGLACIDLIWSGTTLSSETLHTWELEPMNLGSELSLLTLRDVMERHGGELRYQREKAAHRAIIRLALPLLQPPQVVATPLGKVRSGKGRPEYYDFDLFARGDAGIDLDRPLAALAYTVFDTETTGLDPSAGDEIIQIGAVRAVNGRLLEAEVFDELVQPSVPVKPAGIPIHGLTDEMLHGRPPIAEVLPAFHAFAGGTVLVAHNAAFDMRFISLQQAGLGIRFEQPVLDTLLLSTVVHPYQDSHSLEAIAELLGVSVHDRHTALGDALVTGRIFLRLLPLLAERGIVTLGQALAASEQSYLARLRY